jgi:hypothetical protein
VDKKEEYGRIALNGQATIEEFDCRRLDLFARHLLIRHAAVLVLYLDGGPLSWRQTTPAAA